jgi:hypothetical protein
LSSKQLRLQREIHTHRSFQDSSQRRNGHTDADRPRKRRGELNAKKGKKRWGLACELYHLEGSMSKRKLNTEMQLLVLNEFELVPLVTDEMLRAG